MTYAHSLCTVDYRGNDFTGFTDLIRHTFGEEKKLTVARLINPARSTQQNRNASYQPNRNMQMHHNRHDNAQGYPSRQVSLAVMANNVGFPPAANYRDPAAPAAAGGSNRRPAPDSGNRPQPAKRYCITDLVKENPNGSTDIRSKDGTRNITYIEKQAYMREGRCYNCHELGHRVKDCKRDILPYKNRK